MTQRREIRADGDVSAEPMETEGFTPLGEEPVSIFANRAKKLFTTYRVTLQIRNKLLGGRAKDPKLIEGWLRKNMGIDQRRELANVTAQIMYENGHTDISAQDIMEMPENEAFDLMYETAQKAANGKTKGFAYHPEIGLYAPNYIFKAMIKENAKILYPYPKYKWGPTKKSFGGMIAERVSIEPLRIPFGTHVIHGVEQIVGQPQGRAVISMYEYLEKPTITFDMMVMEDVITPTEWENIFSSAEPNGLWAARSQGYGAFVVTGFEHISGPTGNTRSGLKTGS